MIDILEDEDFIDSIKEEEKKQKWKQLQTRLRKMFWNQFQKRAAEMPMINKRLRVLQMPKDKNEFQRLNRRSRAMTILRTIAPQFHTGVNSKIQRRLWQDVMAAANTKSYGSDINMIENEKMNPSGKNNNASNDGWITLLKSEEPGENINKYHYANNVQWPLNPQSQLEPQVI